MRKHSRKHFKRAGQSQPFYIVREGDTLRSIARYLLDDERCYELLMHFNQMESEEVKPGDILYLPADNS